MEERSQLPWTKARIMSTQAAKTDCETKSSSFAARAQSAADKKDAAEKKEEKKS